MAATSAIEALVGQVMWQRRAGFTFTSILMCSVNAALLLEAWTNGCFSPQSFLPQVTVTSGLPRSLHDISPGPLPRGFLC